MKGNIATIGFFDGVHRGHQYLFEQLRNQAAEHGLQPLIITFQQHPRSILQRDYQPQLLTPDIERIELLREQNNGQVEVFDFSQIQALTAKEFMILLSSKYNVSALLMGYDHSFGSDRLRHIYDYKRIGQETGIEVIPAKELTDNEFHISSTEIRSALNYGNIVLANQLLGRPYSISGKIIHGKALGRTIGFPTANLCPSDSRQLLPKSGVYAGRMMDKKVIANIGTNPTIGNDQLSIEVHIPGFNGDLYGSQQTIVFERFIREERKFSSLLSLRRQIHDDLSVIGF